MNYGDKHMKLLIKLILAGVFSAFILGGFLKVVQQVTGKAVYTLLLNVDYFPIVQNWQMGETMEFLLHVITSVILVLVLYVGIGKIGVKRKCYPYILANLAIGGVLFLTTAFSVRTPDIMDIVAFIYWMAGHLIYGIVVGFFLFEIAEKKDR